LFFPLVILFCHSPEEMKMSGRRTKLKIQMNAQTRLSLQAWLRHRKAPGGLAMRARALLFLEQGHSYVQTATWVGFTERNLRKWAKRFLEQGVIGLREQPRPGCMPVFLPKVALRVVKLACEKPDRMGCSLSQWDCPELARKLTAEGLVPSISAETIRRILWSH
jgi:hypothetical protein